jgi:hypothetical protein
MDAQERVLELNRSGFVPGPEETEQQFLKRCAYCLNLKGELGEEIKALLHGQEGEYSTTPQYKILQPAHVALSALADLAPSWPLLFFSNHKLLPWHGGCAWIFQLADDKPTGAFIQLRTAFRKVARYLNIYQRDELLKHELVHVCRMMFQEPKYEEFLAYRTSASRFRRWWGPIISSAKESVLFVFVFALILVFDLFLLATQRADAFQISLWLKSIPIAFLLLACGRLSIRQHRFKKCVQNLTQCLGEESKAWAVLYRLQDSEIEAFARMHSDQIREYSLLQSEKELRWKVISTSYFS